jgi:hypothetical protein
MSHRTRLTTWARLLKSVGPGLEVERRGTTALVVVDQPQFDAEGRFHGVCRIMIEGRRLFGGLVEFGDPPKVTLKNALAGEEPEMARIALLTVEVLAGSTGPASA